MANLRKERKNGGRKENIEGLHVTTGYLLNRTAHTLADLRCPGTVGSNVLASLSLAMKIY
jgi:hypothetical protein